MLRRLHIENFQSHKNTTIDFTNGMNVIIGQSDGGKSSIIRAISAVCYNSWDSDSMRVGETCCKITIETDKGIATLTKDTKNKINSYSGVKFENNEQFLFESVGVTVPQIVLEITGMPPLKIADSAVDIPNIMYQLDKHYMLAEVSGKSCTSNLIARIFDKVIGLGGMEQLITQISSSMINDKKQITKKMAQSDDLNSQLIDEIVLLEKQLVIKQSKKTKKQIQKAENQLIKLDLLLDNYNSNLQKMNQIDDKYINLDVQFVNGLIENIKLLSKKLTLIDNIIVKINLLTNQLNENNDIANKYQQLKIDDIDIIKYLCNKLYMADRICNKYNLFNDQLRELQTMLQKYKQLSKTENLLQKVKKTCNSLYKLDKLNAKLKLKQQQLYNVDEQIKFQCSIYEKVSKQLQLIKKENKICPLCGNSFDKCKQTRQ